MIEIRNLTKSYQREKHRLVVLHDLSFTVENGGIMALMGPSGSGKTTVLNIIAGLDHEYEGTVEVNGTSLRSLGRAELNRYRNGTIGFIFQEFNLLPHLNALENVLIPMMFSDMSHHKARDAGMKALEQVGLRDLWDRMPAELSGGQKQRVAVARALVNGPKIILADEPTANLDARTERSVLDLIVRLASEGDATLIISTHRQDIAARAKKKVILSEEEKVAVDEPEALEGELKA